MFGLEDERKTTVRNLPADVRDEAKYILEETGDATGSFLIKKAPDSVDGKHGTISFKLVQPLVLGDSFNVADVIVGTSNGPESGSVDVSANTTVELQATAIRALSFPGFTVSGEGQDVILTRTDYSNEFQHDLVLGVSMQGKIDSVVVEESENPQPSLLNTETTHPFRFAESHGKTVVVWFNGGYERVNTEYGGY